MKVKNLKAGSKFSRHSFGEIVNIEASTVTVVNEQGYKWSVTHDVVEKEFDFSDYVSETKKVSQTELSEILLENRATVMTVNFNKKVDEKAIVDKILELYPNKSGKLLSESAFKEKVKESISELTRGEERTMIGYHRGSIDNNGRLSFTDMEVKDEHNRRLVDPRTLNYIIVRGVKYIAK